MYATAGGRRNGLERRKANLVGVHARAWGVRQRWGVEGVGHQVLFSVHQVLQLLLSQEALEELAVVWTRQLHAVVPLSRGANSEKGLRVCKCCTFKAK